MTTIEYAKRMLVEFQKDQEFYNEKFCDYVMYRHLPWWKKVFTKRVEKPSLSRFFSIPVVMEYNLVIDIRLYFHNSVREISLAINEGGYGYKLNLDTEVKESLIGSKGIEVSSYAETLMDSIRRKISSIIIE